MKGKVLNESFIKDDIKEKKNIYIYICVYNLYI